MSDKYVHSSADRPRPRNRLLVWLGAGLLLLALLVGIDRGAAWLVAQQQARQLAADFAMAEPPKVTFGGFPFLTQLIGGSFERVQVEADSMTVAAGEQQFELRDTRLELIDVRGINDPIASELHGTAVLGWQSVGALVGSPVSYAGSGADGTGRIQVEYTTTIFGSQVTGPVVGTPVLDQQAQTLSLASPEVSVAGYELPQVVADQLIQQFAAAIPLNLPMDLQVDSLGAESEGMEVAISGTEINFAAN